eukprot:4091899-Alexandrium_andersonii.AAC.1
MGEPIRSAAPGNGRGRGSRVRQVLDDWPGGAPTFPGEAHGNYPDRPGPRGSRASQTDQGPGGGHEPLSTRSLWS